MCDLSNFVRNRGVSVISCVNKNLVFKKKGGSPVFFLKVQKEDYKVVINPNFWLASDGWKVDVPLLASPLQDMEELTEEKML